MQFSAEEQKLSSREHMLFLPFLKPFAAFDCVNKGIEVQEMQGPKSREKKLYRNEEKK